LIFAFALIRKALQSDVQISDDATRFRVDAGEHFG
jgi:hypothetical protein